jgi:hypothetical protein
MQETHDVDLQQLEILIIVDSVKFLSPESSDIVSIYVL